MDRPGFTWGALAELNQKRWALRAGYFLEPTESNGNSYDMDIPTRGQYLGRAGGALRAARRGPGCCA